MRGKEIFYPIGWDDNGLATERRVQNYYGVTCDPTLPYQPCLALPDRPQPDLVPPGPGQGSPPVSPKARVPVSRRNFIELCRELTEQDERAYERAFRQL